MLRIYARVLAAVLVAIAVAAGVHMNGWGLGAGVSYYLGTASVFAYAGFWGGAAWIVRSVVAALGLLLLLSGLGGRSPWASLSSPSEGGVGRWGWHTLPWGG
jgi:hypothetical protein